MSNSLNILGPNKWELIYSEIIEATEQDIRSYRLNKRYLYPFDIPILFDSPVIAVLVTSDIAKPSWYRAGSIVQMIENPQLPSYVPTAGAVATPAVIIERKLVTLNQAPDILLFDSFASTSRFAFDPMPWIERLQIKLWQFLGTATDLVLDGQEDIKAKLDIIDAKVS